MINPSSNQRDPNIRFLLKTNGEKITVTPYKQAPIANKILHKKDQTIPREETPKINPEMTAGDLTEILFTFKPSDFYNKQNNENLRVVIKEKADFGFEREVRKWREKFPKLNFKQRLGFLSMFAEKHEELNIKTNQFKRNNDHLRKFIDNRALEFLRNEIAKEELFSNKNKDSKEFNDFNNLFISLKKLRHGWAYRQDSIHQLLVQKIDWEKPLTDNTLKLIESSFIHPIEHYAQGKRVEYYEERELLAEVSANLKKYNHPKQEIYKNAFENNPKQEFALAKLTDVLEEYLKEQKLSNMGENMSPEINYAIEGSLYSIFHDYAHYLLNDENFIPNLENENKSEEDELKVRQNELRVAAAEGLMYFILDIRSSGRFSPSNEWADSSYANQLEYYNKYRDTTPGLSKEEVEVSKLYGIFMALQTINHNMNVLKNYSNNKLLNYHTKTSDLAKFEPAPTKIIVNGEETTWYELIKKDPAKFEKIISDSIDKILENRKKSEEIIPDSTDENKAKI